MGTSGAMSQSSSSSFSSARSDEGAQGSLNAFPGVEFDGLQVDFAGLDLGEVENVVDDVEQRVGGELHGFKIVALFGSQLGVERQVGHADDAVERGADFVAHVGEELAFGAAGRLGLDARFYRFCFALLLCGNIAPDADDADDVAIADRETGLS